MLKWDHNVITGEGDTIVTAFPGIADVVFCCAPDDVRRDKGIADCAEMYARVRQRGFIVLQRPQAGARQLVVREAGGASGHLECLSQRQTKTDRVFGASRKCTGVAYSTGVLAYKE